MNGTRAVVVTAAGYETTIDVDVYAVSMESRFKIEEAVKRFVDDLFAGDDYSVSIRVEDHPALANL